MTKARILVVDDEEGMLEVCGDILAKLPDAEVILESQSRRAAERLSAESLDLLITDIRMPGTDGVELLRIARRHDPDLMALMITAFPAVETAVESMKLGAVDYLTKPFLPDHLRATVRHLLEERRVRDERRLHRQQEERRFRSFHEIIEKSPAMEAMFDKIVKQTVGQEPPFCYTWF